MNFQNANSEPYYRFFRFHEEFTRNMKVAFGAIEQVRASSHVESGESKKLITLPTGGEPWGGATQWNDVCKVMTDAKHFLSQMSLVGVMSAFEDFLINTEAELDRYSKLIDPSFQSPPQKEMSEVSRTEWICRRLECSTTPLNSVLQIIDYFSIARNVIAHRSSRATKQLIAKVQNRDFQECLDEWKTPRGKKLPALPALELNREIRFLPRHAILASIMCCSAAEMINKQLISVIGQNGVVYMAAYHALFNEDALPKGANKTAVALINDVLFDRYRVTEFDSEATIKCLKEIGKWKHCLLQFERLYT